MRHKKPFGRHALEPPRRNCRRGRGHPVHRRVSEREGYSGSAPFAMGKIAPRGRAETIARELAPIHVAHFVIDGSHSQHAMRSGGRLHRMPRWIPAQSPGPSRTP